jgi:signal transduction histidine kinase
LSVSLADQPCHVRAELGQMDTLLLNLVLNARDAMPEGGVIQVSTELSAGRSDASPLELGLGKGPHVVMVVRDDGVGMDARTLDRIFEPFFTTKADGDGTGLGLATAFGIVERSGGTITVESEVGVGTTFRVRWPCATMDAEDEATPQSLRGAA